MKINTLEAKLGLDNALKIFVISYQNGYPWAAVGYAHNVRREKPKDNTVFNSLIIDLQPWIAFEFAFSGRAINFKGNKIIDRNGIYSGFRLYDVKDKITTSYVEHQRTVSNSKVRGGIAKDNPDLLKYLKLAKML